MRVHTITETDPREHQLTWSGNTNIADTLRNSPQEPAEFEGTLHLRLKLV